jgi:Ni/Fe-hydrogenase 1 B-type cytochrome subunit
MAKSLDHPIPQRIYHWINLVSMVFLVITGFYIHRPYAQGYMHLAKNLHFILMYIILANIGLRIYYAFFGKYKDYRVFAFSKQDGPDLVRTLRGYMYIGPKEHGDGYNSLQKISYITYVFLVLAQFISGYLIYKPVQFQGLVDSLGGLAQLRSIHYLVMWIFIAFCIVHIYLAVKETFDKCKVMLFGICDEDKNVISS